MRSISWIGPQSRRGGEPQMLDQDLMDLTAVLDRITSRVLSGPDGLSGSEAVAVLPVLTEQVSRLTAVGVQVAGVVEASGVWGLDGSRSAKAFLARLTKAPRRGTGSDLKLAKALTESLPLTAVGLAEGSVPVEHARAIAQLCLRSAKCVQTLARSDRGEGFLLSHVSLGLDEYRTFLKRWAYRADPDAADKQYRQDSDGFTLDLARTTDATLGRMVLSPLVAEALTVALAAETGVPAKGDERSAGQRRHDALGSILQRSLNTGQFGELACSRPQVVVHVDYATLAVVLAYAKTSPALADLPGLAGYTGLAPATLQETGLPIPVSVLQELLCDAELIRVVFGPDRHVLDVGRAHRTFTAARRLALNARDRGCVYPGCHAPPWMCQGAHAPPGGWAGGAGSNPEDGALLCYHHHPYVDDNDIRMTRTSTGGWDFHHPDGTHTGTSYPHDHDRTPLRI